MTQQVPHRKLVLLAVLVAIFMVSVESTIVATAMPEIVGHLGTDLKLYTWVFAAYLLSQTATTMVFGKLSDIYGRRPVMLFGIGIFLVGSLLCGFAWSMTSLVVLRLIQGLGAGAVQPLTMTIVGDLYPGKERGQVQGYIASTWSISSVIGPLMGSLIVQHFHWAWIFWINIPLGLTAALGFILFFKENVRGQTRSVDVIGSGLFIVAIAALMVATTGLHDADSHKLLVMGGVFVVIILLFILQERRAADPMIEARIWMHRVTGSLFALAILSGVALIGLVSFLPMYVQVVMGRSSFISGLVLTANLIVWASAATVAGKLMHRVPMGWLVLSGTLILPLGPIALILCGADGPVWLTALGSALFGGGMGALNAAAMVMVQSSVPWTERGAATAAYSFSRNLGSTLGAALLGAVLTFQLGRSGVALNSDHLSSFAGGKSADALAASVRVNLDHGLHTVFWAMLISAVLTIPLALRLPRIAEVATGSETAAHEAVG